MVLTNEPIIDNIEFLAPLGKSDHSILKLNHTFHYDTRKYSFSARIVNIGNSLPNFVVDVDTVCLFKTRLDKFWMHQDVMYDFAADLTGIGDRSVREIS